MITDIFIYKADEEILRNIEGALLNFGFKLTVVLPNEKQYQKDDATIIIATNEDNFGEYIIAECIDADIRMLRKMLSKCPMCGSDSLKTYIPFGLEFEMADELKKSGKLSYMPGAYDRMGTKTSNKECLACGLKWHNGADILHLHNIIKARKQVTAKDL